MSVERKCLSTVLPKLPVPPVMRSVLSLKMLSILYPSPALSVRDTAQKGKKYARFQTVPGYAVEI